MSTQTMKKARSSYRKALEWCEDETKLVIYSLAAAGVLAVAGFGAALTNHIDLAYTLLGAAFALPFAALGVTALAGGALAWERWKDTRALAAAGEMDRLVPGAYELLSEHRVDLPAGLVAALEDAVEVVRQVAVYAGDDSGKWGGEEAKVAANAARVVASCNRYLEGVAAAQCGERTQAAVQWSGMLAEQAEGAVQASAKVW